MKKLLLITALFAGTAFNGLEAKKGKDAHHKSKTCEQNVDNQACGKSVRMTCQDCKSTNCTPTCEAGHEINRDKNRGEKNSDKKRGKKSKEIESKNLDREENEEDDDDDED